MQLIPHKNDNVCYVLKSYKHDKNIFHLIIVIDTFFEQPEYVHVKLARTIYYFGFYVEFFQ